MNILLRILILLFPLITLLLSLFEVQAGFNKYFLAFLTISGPCAITFFYFLLNRYDNKFIFRDNNTFSLFPISPKDYFKMELIYIIKRTDYILINIFSFLGLFITFYNPYEFINPVIFFILIIIINTITLFINILFKCYLGKKFLKSIGYILFVYTIIFYSQTIILLNDNLLTLMSFFPLSSVYFMPLHNVKYFFYCTMILLFFYFFLYVVYNRATKYWKN